MGGEEVGSIWGKVSPKIYEAMEKGRERLDLSNREREHRNRKREERGV